MGAALAAVTRRAATRSPFVLAVGALLLSGCGAGTAPTAPTAATAPTAPTASTGTSAAPSPAAPTGAVSTGLPPGALPTLVRKPAPSVVLAGSGLGLLSGGDTLRRLDFGTDAGTVRTQVEAALGRTGRRQVLCPQGPRTALSADGFSVLLAGNRFVGWTERGSADRDLTTDRGLGLQASVADLRAGLLGLVVRGRTWTSADGLSGRLDADGRVQEISGGETC